MLNAVLAGKAVAVVLAATAPAAVGLSASPVHVTAKAGGSAVVSIRDTGSQRVTVTTSLLGVGKTAGQCHVTSNGAPRGITITPATLTIRPGHAKNATVTVAKSVPASDVAVVFTTADGHRGNVKVNAAVAVQLIITAPGKAVAHRCVSALPPVRKTGLRTQTLEAAGGSALVLVGLGAWWTLRRRRTDPDGEGGSQTMT